MPAVQATTLTQSYSNFGLTTRNAPGRTAHLYLFPTIRPKELRELLTEYGVPDAELEALMQLARRQDRGWWDGYAGVLAPEVMEYCSLEAAAAQIMVYEPQAVPALLQTPPYTRIIAGSGPGTGPPTTPAWSLPRASCGSR
jgi:uncharacterized protein DUF5753